MKNNAAWKNPQFFKGIDPNKCLEEIGNEQIDAKKIVDIARNPNSELHKYFEWDDTKAAEKWRLQQARVLICNLVFVKKDENNIPIRQFHIVRKKGVYEPIKLILQNPDEYQNLLKNAKAELQAFKRKYKSLTELEEIFEKIDEL